MRTYLFLLVAIISYFPTSSIAQNYAVDQIPTQLKSRASAIIRQEHISIDMKNDANISHTIQKTITILNKAGEDHGEMVLYYNKGINIKSIEGVVYDEFGLPVRKFKLKDFSDYSASSDVSMFEDVRVKHYSPNMHSYPYTISYTYEVKQSQNLSIPYWTPNRSSDIAVEKSTYQFSCRPEQIIRIKEQNVPNKVVIDSTEKAKTYTWTASNLNARRSEPYSPNTFPNEIYVKLVPKEFQYFKKKGKVTSWEDMGRWFYEDLLRDKQDLPEATKIKARAIASKYETDKEKAKALYTYLQSKTRYISIQIGIGGIEPFPASYVDRLGYGDCKALVNYMQALLNAVDIKSYYCMVEAGNRKVDLDKDFANIVDGNHAILCIPSAQDTTWLECTSNKSPFGFMGDFTDDRLVLACTPEGGKVLRTPNYKAQDNLQERNGTIKIDAEGNTTGQIQTVFSGTQFDNHFHIMSLTGSDRDKAMKTAYDISNITFNNVKYAIDTQQTKLIEDIDFSIRNYTVKSGGKLIISPNVFNITNSIPEVRNRTNEVYINRGYTDIDSLVITIDDHINPNSQPVKTTYSCPMGQYELFITYQDKTISLHRKLTINAGTYPVTDYEKFTDFMKSVSSSDKGRFTLSLQQ